MYAVHSSTKSASIQYIIYTTQKQASKEDETQTTPERKKRMHVRPFQIGKSTHPFGNLVQVIFHASGVKTSFLRLAAPKCELFPHNCPRLKSSYIPVHTVPSGPRLLENHIIASAITYLTVNTPGYFSARHDVFFRIPFFDGRSFFFFFFLLNVSIGRFGPNLGV